MTMMMMPFFLFFQKQNVKYLFMKGNAVDNRLLFEILLYYVADWASTNKMILELSKSADMFFKSMKSSKQTWIFLSTRPFEQPYTDTSHPFHPSNPACIITYNRPLVNEQGMS
jgi:hypothetical protein